MNCMNVKIKLSEKNIEDVCINDVVLSHDLTHKKNVVKRVIDVFTPIIKSTDQFEFITNTDSLVMSNFHRMWVDKDGDRDWVAAENINVGNSFVDINNVSIPINKVNNNFDTDETFYDLSIEDTHNYFIGDMNYYLSHNSATVNFAWFHYDIMDIMVLKNNAGTDDNRVRKLDYCIGLDKLIFERFIQNKDLTLFSYHECPSLWDNFGLPGFRELYEQAEANINIKFKKKVSARELMGLLAKERLETGRIYTMFVDHANEHGSWLDQVDTSNLCVEINHPLTPIYDVNDKNGEIGVCILAALNWLEIKDDEEMESVCNIIVRMLDSLIEHQNYFVPAAENFAKKRRSLGVGVSNLAALLAKNELKYWDPQAPNFVAQWMEKTSYYLIKASVQMAKELGKCEKFDRTKYSEGVMPIDTYKRDIDEFVTQPLCMNWEELREDIKKHGMRHSTLTACMPVESSSVIQSSTNGIEPPRSLISYKGSKSNILPVVVPGIEKYKDHYTFAFDMPDNEGYLKVAAAIQKFTDMSISVNTYYIPSRYEKNKVPVEIVIKDLLLAYKFGLKNMYYANTDDGDKQTAMDFNDKSQKSVTDNKIDKQSECASGACAL